MVGRQVWAVKSTLNPTLEPECGEALPAATRVTPLSFLACLDWEIPGRHIWLAKPWLCYKGIAGKANYVVGDELYVPRWFVWSFQAWEGASDEGVKMGVSITRLYCRPHLQTFSPSSQGHTGDMGKPWATATS